MPIYNTGQYIAEAVDSLIEQSIGFEENIQIILVNDGSDDNSETICLNYRDKYPNNINYIRKEHEGPSSARNAGLDIVRGEIINFLDPDDIWDRKAFENVYNFYNKNPSVDLIAGRLKFFGARTDYHPLDYKFTRTRVADLRREYDCIQQSAASCFFRASVIRQYRFLKQLTSGEDTQVINQILLEKPLLGLLREAVYYYRKRLDGTSLVQTAQSTLSFYFDMPHFIYDYLLDRSRALYGRPIEFIQYLVMYDIQWRVTSRFARSYLSEEQFTLYSNIIKNLLRQIDDRIIVQQRNIDWKTKLFCLSVKYGKDVRKDCYYHNQRILYQGKTVLNLVQRPMILWYFINIEKDILSMEGRDFSWLPLQHCTVYARCGNMTYYPVYKNYSKYDFITMFGVEQKGRTVLFRIQLQHSSHQSIIFYFSYNGSPPVVIHTSYMPSSHLQNIPHSYYAFDNYIVQHRGREIHVVPYHSFRHFLLELSYEKELWSIHKPHLIFYRQVFWIFHSNRREIYLISDRYTQANDNGEHFFRYILQNRQKGIKSYYCLRRNSSDYRRIQSIGPILSFDSILYKCYYLLASKLISSSSNRFVDDAFLNEKKFVSDILHFDYVFLQHGIIKDDLSDYLHRFNRNFRIFVTSTPREYRSILSYDYYYNSSVVKMTGLPRFDHLMELSSNRQPLKQILIIPTWRTSIKGAWSPINYDSLYSSTFRSSAYFHFYNSLINNPHLISVMVTLGYNGVFCLHPTLRKQWVDFEHNSLFEIINDSVDYQRLFADSALLVTDYSSVFFDFAFLRRPVVYAHFDLQQYRSQHYNAGYWSYLSDGFGPVCSDLNSTISSIIKLLYSNCTMETKYLNRVNTFFLYEDKRNCERVYNVVRSLQTHDIHTLRYHFLLFFSIISICIIRTIRFVYLSMFDINSRFHAQSSFKND